MKYTKHKIFWLWQAEKEEQWLNQMSQNGLQLTSVGYCSYYFEDGNPGEYIYRMELLENMPNTMEEKNHIQFVEDTGAEHIGSVFRYVYFRKKAADGSFDLFSDIDSRIKQLQRILWFIFPFLVINSFNLINMVHLNYSSLFRVFPVETAAWLLCLSVFAVFLLFLYAFIVVLRRLKKLKKEKKIRE